MVEEAVARNDMLFSLSTLRRDCRCKVKLHRSWLLRS
jgi:hypothetical protein